MKGLLLSLGLVALFALCAVCARSDIPIQPDFQDDKIVGKWYSIAMASNFDWFQSKKPYMKLCTTVITPTADGSLEVVSTYPNLDSCDKRTMTYFKTDQPGHFRSKIPRSCEVYEMHVVETNYKEYAVMSMRMTKGTDVYTIATLLGRSKKLRTEQLFNFRNFCLQQGLMGAQYSHSYSNW
ncbi:hypothetical protein FKM82_021691 [Ascaphus truei]